MREIKLKNIDLNIDCEESLENYLEIEVIFTANNLEYCALVDFSIDNAETILYEDERGDIYRWETVGVNADVLEIHCEILGEIICSFSNEEIKELTKRIEQEVKKW